MLEIIHENFCFGCIIEFIVYKQNKMIMEFCVGNAETQRWRDRETNECSNSYLPFVGSGNPSNAQITCGVGLPVAEHFNDTAGPGCNVCSMKL